MSLVEAKAALRNQEASMQPLLDDIPDDRRSLGDWPDTERVPLGLFSKQRQALVFTHTVNYVLRPQLIRLGLL